MSPKPLPRHVAAPALLAVSWVLTAWNWYLQPARATAWAATALCLGVMTTAWWRAARRSRLESGASPAGRGVKDGVFFAALMLAVSLGAKLAAALGLVADTDFAQRATMAIVGAFLMFTGNAVPKVLTPLSSLHCDAATVQAARRVSGWTGVLAGLGLAIAWLTLPIDLAQRLTFVLLPTAVLLIATQCVRLRRGRPHAA